MDTSAALRELEDPTSDPTDGSRRPTLAGAAVALRRQRMPRDEIAAVLTTDDPQVVRRHLELHRERTAEWLDDAQRALSAIEAFLAGTAAHRRRLLDVEAPNP